MASNAVGIFGAALINGLSAARISLWLRVAIASFPYYIGNSKD
jgi:hypothetical protein